MFHKTLESYHTNDPWPEEGEHPDGPLWLIKPEEYNDLPDGITIENVHGNYYQKHFEKDLTVSTPFERERGYMSWGIRGRKDD